MVLVQTAWMGTVAGLELGLRLGGLNTRIEAIRVVPEPVLQVEPWAEGS